MLAIIETHPVQYHAPVYRALARQCQVAVTAIYGSDCSVAGYRDIGFQADVAWDTDLLSGYSSVFLSRVRPGEAATPERASTDGLRQALNEIRPAAVMVVGYSPRFHRVAWFEAWRAGYPILFRGETTDHARLRGRLEDRARSALLTLAYRRCSRLLYVGERSRAHFRALGVEDGRLVFSPYCVDATKFKCGEADRLELRSATRRDLDIGKDQVVILYSGKLSRRKGVDLILEAVKKRSNAARDRIVVAFLGDGEERRALRVMADEPPQVQVRFLGFQNQTQLSRYYHGADLLVLPSRHSETWGLVVNDALHHGLPCVVSDQVGCLPDLIEHGVTGHVCRAESAQSLADALESAESLAGRTDVRAACRDKVATYSVERAALGIAVAYAGSTGASGSPVPVALAAR